MNKKSGHWTNTGMAKFINDNLYNYKSDDEKSMNPFRWYRLQNGEDVSKYRETINGFPCRLILINDGETPLNTGQNEPTPGNTKDMGIFNFNNDKDNVTTLGFNSDIFPNCASYEVTANSDTSAGAFMSFSGDFYVKIERSGVCCTPIPLTFFNKKVGDTFTFDKGWAFYVNSEGTEIYQVSNISASEVPIPEGTFGVRFNVGNFPLIVEGKRIVLTDDKVPDGTFFIPYQNKQEELAYLKESFELRHPDADDVAEDWGFMGVENNVYALDYFDNSDGTRRTEGVPWDGESVISVTKATRIACYGSSGFLGSVDFTNDTAMPLAETTHTVIIFPNQDVEDFMLNGRTCLMRNKVSSLIPVGTLKEEVVIDPTLGLKALIDWVDNCTDEEFVRDFEQHFHKDYTLRYFCLVTLIGAVDNLG